MQNPALNVLAVEKIDNVLITAAETAKEKGIKNETTTTTTTPSGETTTQPSDDTAEQDKAMQEAEQMLETQRQELAQKIQDAQARLDALEIKQEIFDLIDRIDGIEGDVLYERYIKLHKWEDICVLLNYFLS